jgi:hypothetical protein
MKLKVSELTGVALDYAVAEASETPIYISGKTLTRMDMDGNVYWQPSTDWAQGGPIIERECIAISCLHITGYTPNTWTARRPQRCSEDGPTPLIAAMRCYVASKLGDEVELPEELKQ